MHLTNLLARTAPATATAPDIQVVMEASDYVRHGGIARQGRSYHACICPKTECGGCSGQDRERRLRRTQPQPVGEAEAVPEIVGPGLRCRRRRGLAARG